MALVGIVVAELHVPGARSLKDKRRVVKGLVERVHQRHRVSISETAHHDLHQRSQICIAAVGQNDQDIEQRMEALRDSFDLQDAFVTDWNLEVVEIL